MEVPCRAVGLDVDYNANRSGYLCVEACRDGRRFFMKLFDITILAVLLAAGAAFVVLRAVGGKGGTPKPDGAFEPTADRPEADLVQMETAYFAGGCFWGIEDRLQQVPGVIDAVSGYMGGKTAEPTYQEVCTGSTGHAETVRVTFDAERTNYQTLLEWFFKFHDPTQRDRQGPDVGTQYRSAIFAADDEQLRQATAYVKALRSSDRFIGRDIVTQVEPAGKFYQAEEYHQNYHAKHGGSCAIPSSE